MFVQVHTPEQLTTQQLDAYLEQGWFRMGQTIFTTNFLHVKENIHSTIWLRLALENYNADSTQVKLFRRNAGFQTVISPAKLTAEKEILYARYKQTVSFPGSESLQQLLFGKTQGTSIYTTYEITVHDNDQLIACGFFDIGAIAAEGIASFYDPAYKKFSMGKYLIYRKIQYCKDLGLRYFYPGYFVPGNPHFDYKLSIGRETLYFLQLSSQAWLPIDKFLTENIPYVVMRDKLFRVHTILAKSSQHSQVLKYDFFDVSLIPELRDSELLDFPVFLVCGNEEDSIQPLLVFDVRDGMYHWLLCAAVWKTNTTNPDQDFYSTYFLKPIQELHATENEDEITKIILKHQETSAKSIVHTRHLSSQ